MAYGAPSKTRDKPGGAHKRNFNHNSRGEFKLRVSSRGKKSRSKSRG